MTPDERKQEIEFLRSKANGLTAELAHVMRDLATLATGGEIERAPDRPTTQRKGRATYLAEADSLAVTFSDEKARTLFVDGRLTIQFGAESGEVVAYLIKGVSRLTDVTGFTTNKPEAARLQRELREATENVERVVAEKDHRHDRP